MQSTIEQTDVSEPRSAGTPATLTDEPGDASTTITGLPSHPRRRRRRRVVIRAVAAAATLAAAAAAIAIAVVDRSDPDPATHSIPGLIEAPPLAQPHAASAATAALPVFIEGPPLAEPQAAR